MNDITELVEGINTLQGVQGVVLTDESGSPMELPGVEEDDEKAAIAAFIGSGVNSIAETLDLDEFHSMSMNYKDGAMIVYPVGSLYLGIIISETKKLFKVESKINEILN